MSKNQEASRVEASYMLYQGQMMLSQGDYDLALVPLQDCVDRHGNSEFGKIARVSLVQALAAAGDADGALAQADQYLAELGPSEPAHADLALMRAYILADAGRYAEAAEALAAQTSTDLPDLEYYSRTVRRAEWLSAAGQQAAARDLLEELKRAGDAGEVTVQANDLDNRLEVARALSR
jgi:tetratricopeptide (TPR) repeat protein